MAGLTRQRTFELVPETLVPQHAPKRPMTLKQAKRAAQKATKGSKLSRAERARLEKEELDRQRKERDRIRASEKAKSARDKKTLKLAEEKAARKKAGIPEPSRFVRSSQPTISGFVRAGSKRRQIDTESFASGSHASSPHNETLEPTGGKQLNVPGELKIHGDVDDEEAHLIPSEITPQPAIEPIPDSISTSALPISGTNLSANLIFPLPTSLVELNPPVAKKHVSTSGTNTKNNLKLVCEKASEGSEEFDDDAELFAAMAESDVIVQTNTRGRVTRTSKGISQYNVRKPAGVQNISSSDGQLDSKILQSTISKKAMPPPPIPQKQISKTRELVAETPRSLERPNLTRLNTLRQGGMNAPPPPRLPTQNKRRPLSNKSINIQPLPRSLKRLSHSAPTLSTSPTKKQASPTHAPLSSTQAFLFDNLEDFFLSPSQQIRELYSASQNDQIQDRQDCRPRRPSTEGKSKNLLTESNLLDNYVDMFPSLSQEMREMIADGEVDQRIQVPSLSTSGQNPDARFEDRTVPEINIPMSKKVTATNKVLSTCLNKNKKDLKNRFFTEKAEDIIQVPLVESLQSSKQETASTSKENQSTRKREFSRITSESSNYDDGIDWNSREVLDCF